MLRIKTVWLLSPLLVLLVSCDSAPIATVPSGTVIPLPTEMRATLDEQPVIVIPLLGDVTKSKAEVSGLAWYGDYLVILPQYPSRFDEHVFVLSKEDLLAFLDGVSTAPLTPQEIPFIAPDLSDEIKGFEGYEAITFQGERVFVTIEAEAKDGMRGYLVAGEIAPDLSALRLDVDTVAEIAPQADLDNKAYESLLVVDGELVTLYEANGQTVNPEPVAKRFDGALAPLAPLSFPSIEYRVTDATALDGAGRFWAINYFYPNDVKFKPTPDPLMQAYGLGPTHARFRTVERLVEFLYTPAGISLSEKPPIYLELIDDDHSRNWEGIVRLDDRGFLLMTDEHPETILAFVAEP